MPVTRENAAEVVRYHPPTAAQVAQHEKLAVAAEEMVNAILSVCPVCADATAAVRYVRMAKMTASAAVALDGLI